MLIINKSIRFTFLTFAQLDGQSKAFQANAESCSFSICPTARYLFLRAENRRPDFKTISAKVVG